jgi:peptidoglycan/LPS O-acetylase OafA/YrhL
MSTLSTQPEQARAAAAVATLPGSAAVTDNAHSAFLSQRQIPNLDALRGISILWVFLHHVPLLPWPWARAFQENGRHGVSFFFVISGFLITTLFLREERTTGQIQLLRFYGRRMLRLMPLYYLVLLLYCGIVLGLDLYSAENRALFIQKLPAYIFYYSNLLPVATQGPFFFSWSLAVEEQFYLLFGLSMRWLSRRTILAVVGGLIALKLTLFALHGPEIMNIGVLRVALSYHEPILMGVLLGFAMNTRLGFSLCQRFLADWRTLAVLGLGIAVAVSSSVVEGRSSGHAVLLYTMMTLFVAGAVLRPNIEGLGAKFAAHVGKVSYGMYLLHMLVINATRKVFDNPFFVLAVGIPATIGIATAVYNYIEAPLLRYRHWFEPKAKNANANAPTNAKVPVVEPKPVESRRPAAGEPAPTTPLDLMGLRRRLNLMP